MKKFFAIALWFLIAFSLTAETGSILILKDGREYKGILKKIDEKEVNFLFQNKTLQFARGEIAKIHFFEKRLFDDYSDVREIKDAEIQSVWKSARGWKSSPDKKAVILLDRYSCRYDKNNRAVITIRKAYKILNEDGKSLSNQYFYYLKKYFNASLTFAVTINGKGTLSHVEESAVNDEPINGWAAGYDNLRRLKFGLKDTDIGSVFIWEAKIEGVHDPVHQPHFFSRMLVQEEDLASRILEFEVPAGMPYGLSYTKGLVKIPDLLIRKEKKGGFEKITITQKNISSFINTEGDLPSGETIYPVIRFSLVKKWDELTKTYAEEFFEKPVSSGLKEWIQKNRLQSGSLNEQAEHFYQLVNRQIKGVQIEMNDDRYSPKTEAELITLPGLNALDKTFLYIRIMKELGVPAKMLFYRSQGRGKTDGQCPSLEQFDSVIGAVVPDGVKKYVSFENSEFSLGQRYFETSGADALDVSSAGKTIEVLDVLPVSYNRTEIRIDAELGEDNSLKIVRTTSISGEDEPSYRSRRYQSLAEQEKWFLSRLSGLGNNAELKSYRFVNKPDDYKKNILMEEVILLKNFAYPSGKQLKVFKLPGYQSSAGAVSLKERKFPFELDNTRESAVVYRIRLPEGYKVLYVPEPVKISVGNVVFQAQYTVNGNLIELKSEMTVGDRQIQPAL